MFPVTMAFAPAYRRRCLLAPLLLFGSVSTVLFPGISTVAGFVFGASRTPAGTCTNSRSTSTTTATAVLGMTASSSSTSSSAEVGAANSPPPPPYVVKPSERDAKYSETGGGTAQYLVDLHDAKATFNFCGGMMFQLVLSEKLRNELVRRIEENKQEKSGVDGIKVHDASQPRMHMIPEYKPSSTADNARIFHGREIRNVPSAAGGMGFVLQLSLANSEDPEGWTAAEIADYDGWKHDAGRNWRTGGQLETDGYAGFRKRYGPDSFALHHRFYFRHDRAGLLWLSAEDGCEGTPALASAKGRGGGNGFLSNLMSGF